MTLFKQEKLRLTAVPDLHKPIWNHTAGEVLRIEGGALLDLATSLDEKFDKAIDLLLNTEGKVIITGIGKSGHIARKFAATLASTGTPSFFIHPGEASHGDLGMISKNDVIIALSNSGNTKELSDIIVYSRRFSIPLIGVTRCAESELARNSDISLTLPANPEACPHGLAPTTSTTMMLALGDAIAVTLLRQREFTPHQFKLYHPGGILGSRLKYVKDLMHTGDSIPLVTPDTKLDNVILVITSKCLGCVGVIKDDKLVGVITDGDLRRNMRKDLLNLFAGQIMSPNPRTIRSEALAAEALAKMNTQEVTSLFVADDNEAPVGIVHIHDCLRYGIK